MILVVFHYNEDGDMEFGNFPSVFTNQEEIIIGGATFFGSDHSLAYVFSSNYLFS